MIFSENRVPPFRIMLESMIRKKPTPDLVRGGNRLPEKIVLDQKVRAPIDSI
jgi:hypothetical protein